MSTADAWQDLAQTGAQYSAVEKHSATAVVLRVFGSVPHFVFASFRRRLLRLATFSFSFLVCSLKDRVLSRVTPRYTGYLVFFNSLFSHGIHGRIYGIAKEKPWRDVWPRGGCDETEWQRHGMAVEGPLGGYCDGKRSEHKGLVTQRVSSFDDRFVDTLEEEREFANPYSNILKTR